MTATPTPGDLSARLLPLAELLNRDSATFLRGAGREHASNIRAAIAAIAALSALPAAGGEVCRVCGGGPGNFGVCLCGEHDYTTPQPSAAEEAAVGAQGNGELAWQNIENAEAEFLRNLADKGGLQPLVSGMLRHCARLLDRPAAPAAGKGVDAIETIKRIAAQLATDDCVGDAADLIDAMYALTRQPVAGDGMVLVPREPTHAMIAAGWKSIRCDVDPGRKPQTNTARRAARNAYVSMLAAAPAATPTDGGEG